MVVRAFEIMATDHLDGGRGVDGQTRNVDGYVGIFPHGFRHGTPNISLYFLQKEDGLVIKAAAKNGPAIHPCLASYPSSIARCGDRWGLGGNFLIRGTRERDHGH